MFFGFDISNSNNLGEQLNVGMNDQGNYVGLGISAISVISLILLFPALYYQIKGLCKHKESPRSKFLNDKIKIHADGSIGEASDDSSMFVRPSDDWNPQSSTNQASFLTPKYMSVKEDSCCYQNTKRTTLL